MGNISRQTSKHTPRKELLALWETVTCGDAGASMEVPDWVKTMTVQVIGTFNSQTLSFQGSNDNSNWSSLTDTGGSAIELAAAGLKVAKEFPRYVRPSFSGSSGGDVDVYVYMRAA